MTESAPTHTLTEAGWTVQVLGDEFRRIDENHVPSARASLSAAAEKAIAEDPKRLLLDLSRVEFFGSSFIEVLFSTFKRMKEEGGRFAVCGCTTHCQEVMEITKLDSVWGVYRDRQSATAAS